MMKPFGALLLLLGLGLVVFSVMIGAVSRQAIDAWALQAAQPVSVTDTIMQSRQTPPLAQTYGSYGVWSGAGLLALGVLVIGAVLFMMHGGTEFLRQWRLARKRPFSRHHSAQYAPRRSHWTELPDVPTVRYLPEVDDEQVAES